MSTVTITEEPLALEDLLAVVDGAQVELADSARASSADETYGLLLTIR